MNIKSFVFFVISISFVHSQDFTKAIEDNSFFIEEAYNQEAHVVQHIFSGTINSTFGILFATSFTQEWPVFGQLHQLSFTIPYQYSDMTFPPSWNTGDILINYRYQVINENGLALAPRASLILPTGDETNGFGNGVVGMQFNVPVSKRFSNEIVAHYNAGMTIFPHVQFQRSKATITEYFFGSGAIYLANPHFNVMTELLYTSSGSTFGRSNKLIVSPGLRWAIDIGGVQIVPGLAFPFQYISEVQWNGFLLYLSIEHPY